MNPLEVNDRCLQALKKKHTEMMFAKTFVNSKASVSTFQKKNISAFLAQLYF